MRRWDGKAWGTVLVMAILAGATALAQDQELIKGEPMDTSNSPQVVESMFVVQQRDLYTPRPLPKGRNGGHGAWVVPNQRATHNPHSGRHNIVNSWGDTRMGIGFPETVDVLGAWFGAQAGTGAATTGVRVIGYRDGQEVQSTDWFTDLGAQPTWFEMDLRGVDRIEIQATPVLDGAGWYALDDLTYAPHSGAEGQKVVVTFDDLEYGKTLTGTNYAGLTWETGTGDFSSGGAMPAPQEGPGQRGTSEADGPPNAPSATDATTPALTSSFQGVIRGDAGQNSYPPDTCGAIGPSHFVEVVNTNLSIYNRTTGQRVVNTTLSAFLPGSSGDGRVLYDLSSGRWIIHVDDFSSTLYLAVSTTSDPTGNWFKTSVNLAQGGDAGKWPDYPTLGVDANGIYAASYMVGGSSQMSIFAINKAPLIAANPSLGAVTAFRNLPWEGAIQPAITYGTPSGEYLMSTIDSSHLRLYRVNPPLTAPTLQTVAQVAVNYYADPPLAEALGSSTALDTVGSRLMMAVYRNGYLWTAHTIAVNGMAACRWYQINTANNTVTQWGNVADTSMHYFFPSIMVNQYNHAIMGFTGSSSSQYASCYYTGRLSSDTLGTMAPPVRYKPGMAAQNNMDSYGRNRWGDYSLSTLDPNDQTNFWTIQEYGHANNIWGTYVAALSLGGGDCNNNGILDFLDIQNGTSQDCNTNSIPDECELAAGTSHDCNSNGLLDECDIANGMPDCNTNGYPDACDIAAGLEVDCNGNGIPDSCDVATGYSRDCDGNGVPDECELASQPGLAGGYFLGNTNFTGAPRGRVDPTIGFNWASGPWPGIAAGDFCVRWTGLVRTPNYAGTYTFYARTDDGVRLWVGNQSLINQWTDQTAPTEFSGTLTMQANTVYTIQLEYYKTGSGTAVAELRWAPPGQAKQIIPSASLLAGRDCNGNGVLDLCDFSTSFSATSPVLSPLGGVTQTYTLVSPPDATSNVTFDFNAYGDLNFSSEYVAVDLNGTSIGNIYTQSGYQDCVPNQLAQIIVTPATFNLAKAGGNVAIHMVPSAGVSPTQCDPDASHIQVTVSYVGNTYSHDTNGNGIPDECETPVICRGDCDCDGRVSFSDIDYFVAAIPDNQTAWQALYQERHGGANPTCAFANCDVNADGHVNFADIDPFVALIPSACP